MSKFSQLLKMIEMLKVCNENDLISTEDLAANLGVSKRMIRKYVYDIKEADINIISKPGPGGGFYIK